MDPLDRLVGYLAGELDADEHAAIEAALAHDSQLRRQLAALRAADDALTQLRPPEPPAGFEARLDATVDEALAELRAESTDTEESVAPAVDELAVRRERRGQWSWKPAFAGAAAALALLVGGIVVSQFAGRDDADMAALDAPAAELAEDFAGEPGEEASDDGEEAGPVIVASGRDLTGDEVDALLAEPTLTGVANRHLDEAGGALLAMGWQAALGSSRLADDPPAAVAPEADAGVTAQDESVDTDEDTRAMIPFATGREVGGPLSADDETAIARCLDEVLTAEARAIPAYVEFATFDGEDVLVYGLVTLDPATGAYSRTEAWVVARSDCQPLRFSQGG